MASDDPLAPPAQPASATVAPSGEATAEGQKPQRRDRIVVLGRTQAGKTVYLARLYDTLWREGHPDLKIRATNGATHKACMELVETLRSGRWPSSTTGIRYFDLEIEYQGHYLPLVMLDYPGEVFRRAFVDDGSGEDVAELLDHIDGAAGLIMLVDPKVVLEAPPTTALDDDFGMMRALQRIASWPDGRKVPVSLVLTKWDKRKAIVEQHGGFKHFTKRFYKALFQAGLPFAGYTCSAVQEAADGEAGSPRSDSKAIGVVEPLLHVVKRVCTQLEHDREAKHRARSIESRRRRRQEERGRQRRSLIVLTMLYVGFALIAGAAGLVTWLLVR